MPDDRAMECLQVYDYAAIQPFEGRQNLSDSWQ